MTGATDVLRPILALIAPGTVLRDGLERILRGRTGALIVLCDQPALNADHLRALCHAWRETPKRAVASFYAGKLGVPALLPRAWFDDAMEIGRASCRERVLRLV